MSNPDTKRLKSLVHAVLCAPNSSTNMHVEYSEVPCRGDNTGLVIRVFQSDGDFGSNHVYTFGEPFDIADCSKAKDFHELVREAEYELEKLAQVNLLKLSEVISAEDKILNFYDTYFNWHELGVNPSVDYLGGKAKRISSQFANWLENKFFPQIDPKKSFPNKEDFLNQYRKYCTFES